MSPLAFVLGNFWHFMGAAILIVLLFEGLTSIIRAFCKSDPWHD
jgi:hypothetical protein